MLSFLITFFLSSQSLSAGSPHPNIVMCKNNKIVRTIRVDVKEDESCETTYTKSGVDRTIGSGNIQNSCENILKNVKGNLEEAGWNCKDISQANIKTE